MSTPSWAPNWEKASPSSGPGSGAATPWGSTSRSSSLPTSFISRVGSRGSITESLSTSRPRSALSAALQAPGALGAIPQPLTPVGNDEVVPASNGSAFSGTPRSTVLSRRNSSVWLATATIDMCEEDPSTPVTSLAWRHARHHRRGPLSLDMLPIEVLALVLGYVASGPEGNFHLYRLLSTCGRLYDVGIALLYRHVIFRYPQTFDKFRWSIVATGYGQHVRVIDFSAFTSVGLGRTMRLNMEIEMVTSRTILNTLDRCPQLIEFLAAESIDTDINGTVLDRLIGSMPVVAAVDFCGSAHPQFVHAFRSSQVLETPGYLCYNLTRVSLHSCSTLPSESIEALLGRLANVQKLDLTYTQVTSVASLPQTARLTHLFLSRCGRLEPAPLVDFFETHAAVKKLRWLSLKHDITRPSPVTVGDLERILRVIPPKLCYLDISGHKPSLEILLQFKDLQAISIAWCSHLTPREVRRLMLTLTNLQFVDIAGTTIDSWMLQEPSFLNINPNIKMIEIAAEARTILDGVKIPGWLVDANRGRRAWLHRMPERPEEENVQPSTPTETRPPFTFVQLAQDLLAGRGGPAGGKGNRTPLPRSQAKTGPPSPLDPIWEYASHKVNVSEIGQGPAVVGTEGIYNYYAFYNL